MLKLISVTLCLLTETDSQTTILHACHSDASHSLLCSYSGKTHLRDCSWYYHSVQKKSVTTVYTFKHMQVERQKQFAVFGLQVLLRLYYLSSQVWWFPAASTRQCTSVWWSCWYYHRLTLLWPCARWGASRWKWTHQVSINAHVCTVWCCKRNTI